MNQKPFRDNDEGDIREVSLSAALLAPLTSLVKAQLHASRAFLGFLLELGYRHIELDENGLPVDKPVGDLQPFTMDFVSRVQVNGHEQLQKITVPALALVPTSPLGVESAEFEYDFKVDRYEKHTQLQPSRVKQEEESKTRTGSSKPDGNAEKRPWYLVEQPVSLRGQIDGRKQNRVTDESGQRETASMRIKVKVGKIPVPSGLDRLLTALTQAATTVPVSPITPIPAKE